MSEEAEEIRFESLSDTIADIYEQRSFAEQLAEEATYSELRLGVFEVTSMGAKGCTVFEIYYDYEVAPVVFMPAVQNLLKEKDVFLLSLGKRAGKWYVVYQSRPYESMEWAPEESETEPEMMVH